MMATNIQDETRPSTPSIKFTKFIIETERKINGRIKNQERLIPEAK